MATRAPKFMAYIERFHAHPKLAEVQMNQQAMDAYCERAVSWPVGVKCQLSLDILKGIFADCP